MQINRASTHGDKLKALLKNDKLPKSDIIHVTTAITKYESWKTKIRNVTGEGRDLLSSLIASLNEYKRCVELDLIFDSPNDFLYRQKGQLKLDNTILEEFLPYLFDPRLVKGIDRLANVSCGSQSSFAGLSFASPFIPLAKGGVFLKLKDQDFSVAKVHHLKITDSEKNADIFESTFVVSHFAAEIKTNLDKTMFQEASQTSAELKRAVPGAKYMLLCEFLDMTPITTKLTSIDEVIVLRKAKRLSSNIRANFSTSQGRKRSRSAYVSFLDENPLYLESFERFIWHLNECFPEKAEDAEDIILERGYF